MLTQEDITHGLGILSSNSGGTSGAPPTLPAKKSGGILGAIKDAASFVANDLAPGGGPKPQAQSLPAQIFQSTLGSHGAAGLVEAPVQNIGDAIIGKVGSMGANPQGNADLARVNEALSAKAASLPAGDPNKAALLRQVFENTQILSKNADSTRALNATASLPAGQDSTLDRIKNVGGQALNTAATFAPVAGGGALKAAGTVGGLSAAQSVGDNLQQGASLGKTAKDAAVSFAIGAPLGLGGNLAARGVSAVADKVAPSLDKAAEFAYRRTYPKTAIETSKEVAATVAGHEQPMTAARWALDKGLTGNPVQQATTIKGITDNAVKGMQEVAKTSPVTTKVVDPPKYRAILQSIIGGFDDSLDQPAAAEGKRLLQLLNKDNDLWERPELLDFQYMKENADKITVGQLMNAIKAKGGNTNFIPTGINPATKLDKLAVLNAEDTLALRQYLDRARLSSSFKLNPSLSNKQDAYRAASDEMRGLIRKNYPEMVPYLDDYHHGINAYEAAIKKAVKEGNEKIIGGLASIGAGGVALFNPAVAAGIATGEALFRGGGFARPSAFLGRQLKRGADIAAGARGFTPLPKAAVEAAKKALEAGIGAKVSQ